MGVELRLFDESDRARCQRIAAAAAMSSYGPRLDGAAFSADDPLEACDQRWLAIVDGEVAGFIELIGAHVSNLFVDPGFQGRGVGSRLMAAAEAAVEGDLTLSVFTVNPGARRLYERLGFVVEGTGPVAFAGGQRDVWRMRKSR